MLQRRYLIGMAAFMILCPQSRSFAAEIVKPELGQEFAQLDSDDSYDPFADYSEFDQAQEEEEDINFFRNGRFITLNLLLGYRGFTGTLGSLYSGGFDFGVGLTYFFDMRFAIQFSFTDSNHSFGFVASDGPHSGTVQIQDFGFDLKYYINTQNVTKGLAKFNPYLLLGCSLLIRDTAMSNTSAQGVDNAFAFDIGGGIELPMMRNKMFYGVQAMFQAVTFPDAGSPLQTVNGVITNIYPSGDTYNLLGVVGLNY